MGCVLLTGATGLLGAHLLRNWLRDEVPLCVVVRPSNAASAASRVEQLISRWDAQAGYELPRPVVLEGDIAKPHLGLSAQSLNWVARHCTAVMHNAASLAFVGKGPGAEPYRSNVGGTRHVLELCRTAGIRHFHHVSTAYVCGARDGVCLETELDVGQSHGNDYEISKFESEQLVHRADFLATKTVYRPGIILGDSQEGWTTTFHGFYVPLKLVATLLEYAIASGLSTDELQEHVHLNAKQLLALLGFHGSEQKNFVPVDWVADAMTSIYARPEHHGRTYHLTPETTTPISLMQEVLESAFLENAKQSRRRGAQADETLEEAVSEFGGIDFFSNFEQFFVKRMDPYRSYWRDDPQFDTTNTRRAVPHLSSPVLDAACLTRMCEFALRVNFGFPKEIVRNQRFSLHDALRPLFPALEVPNATHEARRFGLSLRGAGGGQWSLGLAGHRIVAADPGPAAADELTLCLNTRTWLQLSARESTFDEALSSGALLLEGMRSESDHLVARAVLSQLLQGAPQLQEPAPAQAPVATEPDSGNSNGPDRALRLSDRSGPIVVFDATQRRKERLRTAARSVGAVDGYRDSSPSAAAYQPAVLRSPPAPIGADPLPRPANVGSALSSASAPLNSGGPLNSSGPVNSSGRVNSNGNGLGNLSSFLVDFVVEQTGYPPDMVELDADLEADLGIDSIKKAQLFGELAQHFEMRSVGDLSLEDFPTLRHVLDFLEGIPRTGIPPEQSAPPQVSPENAVSPGHPVSLGHGAVLAGVHSNGSGPDDLSSFLIDFVVEQTGYPPDMVELDADLEADLGIDSIKKAQLFGELAEDFEIRAAGDLSLEDFPTLRHVLQFLEQAPRKQNSQISAAGHPVHDGMRQ